jgi:hypothetical protein
MKVNPFHSGSNLYPFRWFILVAIGMIGWLAYANLTGWRLFYSSPQQQWSASGPGYHK